MKEETIVAIATSPGKSGVAIVRISGDKSLDILKKITKCSDDFLPRYMYLKNIYIGDIVDNALVVYFKNPYSFTGEDVVEIQCHGGYFIANETLKQAIEYGARLAQAGEFSKRAFLNGKMSVDQAEGIMDIINAESLAQAKAGSELIRGELHNLTNDFQGKLTDILAEIEAKLDYPEYDFDESETNFVKSNLIALKNELQKLLDTHILGVKIKNGVKVAIVGKPNVGKSSLLNAITHSDKAIVTDIAGTTRDVIEAEYQYKGMLFRLFDTAGIHSTEDVVEKMGIDKAVKTLKDADLVLLLQEIGENEEIETYNKPLIKVFTKSDLHNNINENDFCGNKILISAVKNQNIEKIK